MVYKVKQGDTISAIAKKNKVPAKKILDKNAKTLEARESGDILLTGDELDIPAPEEKDESLKLEATNRFYIDQEHGEIKICFQKYNKPRKNLKYTPFFENSGISNKSFSLDGNGIALHEIDHDEKIGKIDLKPEEDSGYSEEKYTLKIGELDPIDTLSGIQARLKNLGYYFEKAQSFPKSSAEKPYKEEEMDLETKNALAIFQIENELEPTGIFDDKTKEKLKVMHGC